MRGNILSSLTNLLVATTCHITCKFSPKHFQYCATPPPLQTFLNKAWLYNYGTYHRYSNLIHVNIGVRGYDRASSIVHSLPHHVLTKQPLLLFKNLQNRQPLLLCMVNIICFKICTYAAYICTTRYHARIH